MKINNVAYSWAMIQLSSSSLTGSSETNPELFKGISALKWNIKQNTKPNYGLGGEPASRGFGNIEYTASITMDFNTQLALRALAGGKSLRDLGEFSMTISYAGVETGMNTETTTLEGCFFNEDGMDAKQDDTNITKEFNLNPFRIINHPVEG